MPRVSSFYGISIYMYHREHPPPHFHVIYGEHVAEIGIDNMVLLNGRLPQRATDMVLEWTLIHQAELRANWERARNHEAVLPIQPLE